MVAGMMKAKSVTFRCSAVQYRRMEKYLEESCRTRSELICNALDSFLTFAEGNRHLNLFELVDAVNALGTGVKFEEQA